MDCPWDLTRYGGSRPYFGLFDDKPDYLPRGRCFPGGHSSAGFALFGLYFAAIQLGLRRHRWYLLPALMVGGLFALDQWVRGAHFPSHDLTTAYICWMTTLVTYGRFFHDSGQRDR
jgi:membrane-associated PAP2 superfamily phosphatase